MAGIFLFSGLTIFGITIYMNMKNLYECIMSGFWKEPKVLMICLNSDKYEKLDCMYGIQQFDLVYEEDSKEKTPVDNKLLFTSEIDSQD